MRVITEKRLRELFENFYMENILVETLESNIMDECKEIDILTVSKLRPMCDAQMDGESFLVVFKGSTRLHEAYFDSLDNLWSGDKYYSSDLCEGFIPIPIYNPELTGDGEKTAG